MDTANDAGMPIYAPSSLTLNSRWDLRCLPEDHLVMLFEVAQFVAEVANLAPDEHMAYVGKSAFAHKGGIHVAAMRRTCAFVPAH